MNTNETPTPSQEERMLRQLGGQLTEIAKTIFGTQCRLELNITGAPVSKVALIKECNKNAAAGEHRVYISAEDRFCINVCDANYLPF